MIFFRTCVFSHGDTIRDFARDDQGQVLEPKQLVFRCQDCQQVVQTVLPGQVYTARKVKKSRKVKAKSADVLSIAKRSA
jgi:hypothetical protein